MFDLECLIWVLVLVLGLGLDFSFMLAWRNECSMCGVTHVTFPSI